MPINLDEAIRARDFAELGDAFDGVPPSELATPIRGLPIDRHWPRSF